MYAQHWEIGTVLGLAWQRFKEHAAVVLICVVITGAVSFAFSLAGNLLQQAGPLLINAGVDGDIVTAITVLVQLLVSFVSWLVQTWFGLGMAVVMLKTARGLEPAVGDLFGVGRYYLAGLLGGLLLAIGVTLGICLLIVPGIIFALGTMFYLFCIVDQDLGPIECLKESWRLTDGEKLNLLVWAIACFGITLAGVLACCVGLLVAGPVVGIGSAAIYDNLVSLKGRADGGQPTSGGAPGDVPLRAKP